MLAFENMVYKIVIFGEINVCNIRAEKHIFEWSLLKWVQKQWAAMHIAEWYN